MKEENARELVEKFPDWLEEASKKSQGKDDAYVHLVYIEGIHRAKKLISSIQWFVHVLYLNGFKITKK